jgi:hypothetical protein
MDIVWGNGTHTSCRNINDLGYCIVSTDGIRDPTLPRIKYQSEIIKLYLDSTMSVPKYERLAHVRTAEYYVENTPYSICPMASYWAAPHASINNSGDKIIYRSTWGDNCKSENYILQWSSSSGSTSLPSQHPSLISLAPNTALDLKPYARYECSNLL